MEYGIKTMYLEWNNRTTNVVGSTTTEQSFVIIPEQQVNEQQRMPWQYMSMNGHRECRKGGGERPVPSPAVSVTERFGEWGQCGEW